MKAKMLSLFKGPFVKGPFIDVCVTEDREAWLAARNTGVGASEIAVLLGASEWSSPLAMYLRKTGEPEPESVPSEAMQWGTLLEGTIITETARRAGVELLSGPSRLLRSTLHPWALATCDAVTTNGEPVEVKAISAGFTPEEWESSIPQKYLLQCQQQMLVTGAQRCLFGALLWGQRLVWEWIPRDETLLRDIIAAGAEFWARVESGDAPDPDGHPGVRKLLAARATDPAPVELFEQEIGPELAEYVLAKDEAACASSAEREAKKRLEAAKDALALRLGKHVSGATSTGWHIGWKTTERRGYTVEPTTVKTLEIKKDKQ